jgi:cytochrome P450
MTFVLQSFIGFFQAGTDTTAHSIVGLLVALAQNPELQTELRREINKNVPNPAQLDSAQLSSLKYTHAFMQEAQRVHNAVVTLLPRKALNTHQVADLRIHKGWYVNCYL